MNSHIDLNESLLWLLLLSKIIANKLIAVIRKYVHV